MMGLADEIAARSVAPLPCPFCGKLPAVKVLDGPVTCGTVQCETVDCPACPITSGSTLTQEADAAILNWNKRHNQEENQ